jgi:signal transduction histidine kinase
VWQHRRVRASLRDSGWRALLVVLLLHCPLSAVARGETRQVLVLLSSDRSVAPHTGFADVLVRDLIRSSREPIHFIEVSVQAARASAVAPDVSITRRIRSAFGADTLDLVVTIGGPAATFAQQFRQELFPATPTLIAGVDRRFVENRTFTDNETTVATQHDPALMIDEILRLLPGTRTVMVVVGASHVEQFWLQEMQREFRRFDGRLQFIWTNELSFDEIVERSRTMPSQSAIFFALLSLDGKGEPHVEGDTVMALHAVANVPMFALYGVGRGIVGGPMLSTGDLSRTTTQVALRVLAGESPGSIATPTQRVGQATYDARELRRWKIDEDRLLPASTVLFREPPMWRRPMAVGALLGGIPAVAFVLLVGLVQRRRRQGSGGQELSNLSRHLMQAHERERATLARTLHDDVCQRMVGLTLRLHKLQGVQPAGEIAEIRDELAGLVGEIAAVADPVHQRLQALGLTTAGRRFCQDLSARHDVAIHFQAADVPRDLPFDSALALFRVLQDATVNAIVHSAASEVWVSVRGTAAAVRLQVVDRGVGFDTRRAMAGDGVGLVAIRERLKLVNGDSVIVSRPGQGTRVEAWVPLVDAGRATSSDNAI